MKLQCKNNDCVSLTIDKEYEVLDKYKVGETYFFTVINNEGDQEDFSSRRFLEII